MTVPVAQKFSTTVSINKQLLFGGKQLQVIAGPCAVESQQQILASAAYVSHCGCRLLRGGAFKPRTRPGSFQGLGVTGLELLQIAKQHYQLPIVSELMDVRDLDFFLTLGVDIIQVGSRNMQNFALLKELAQLQVPVLLKRGMAATLNEWLGAAEYLFAGGNEQIILCERGVRSFEPSYRNMLDITAIPYLKQHSGLPVIVDPSHAAGQAALVPALCHAAIAAGADGLLIETHPCPEQALSDKEQALSPKQMALLMDTLAATATAVGRSL